MYFERGSYRYVYIGINAAIYRELIVRDQLTN